MKTKLITIFIFCLLISNYAYSQKGESINNKNQGNQEEAQRIDYLKNLPLHGFGGIYFSNSVPQNEYMDNLKQSGPGFGFLGGYRFEPIPITVGGQFDMVFFGGETRYYNYKLPNGWTYARDTLNTTSWSMPITAFVRLEPNLFNFVYPYLEAFAGFSLMNANANYKSNYGVNDDKNEFSANFNYGLGAGASFKLTDFILLPNNITRMLLDVKFRYMSGNETDYYTVKANSDGSVTFDKFRSKTDQVFFNIGLVFYFGNANN